MSRRFCSLVVAIAIGSATAAWSQTLLVDEFNGTGLINQQNWRLAFGGDGAFFGQTQLRTDLTADYPSQVGGSAILDIDTFIDDGMGGSTGSFLGTEINTKRNFARAGGLRVEARVRLDNPPAGVVGGIFLFDVTRSNTAGDLVRDEIDFLLLGNEVASGTNRPFTNIWNDGPFTGEGSGGDPAFAGSVPSLTDFHDYRIDWLPNRVEWYVDDMLVRTQTSNIPDDPMNFRLNYWVPDAGFSEAYSPSLLPAANAGANQTFQLEVDRVEITRLNTIESDNLLLDQSFEDPSVPAYTFPLPPGVTATDTGGWYFFNNANFDTAIAQTGILSVKSFGPFSGNPDASGFWQNVDVMPGDELEGRVFAQSLSSDTIKGNANFATVKIEFIDALGNVVADNAKESVVLEGRDPDMPEDIWVEGVVNAVAPANAVKARFIVPMIQLENQGGAVWFDDVSLVKLQSTVTPISGDFNNDGTYDCLDVDPLVADIAAGANTPAFDLTGDGLVNGNDLAAWLVEGGNAEVGGAFLSGDANLDGVVDVSDFNIWNGNKFNSVAAFCSGDFNADGSVDVSDFNLWNGNKFQASGGAAVVPEPQLAVLLPLVLAGLYLNRRQRRIG